MWQEFRGRVYAGRCHGDTQGSDGDHASVRGSAALPQHTCVQVPAASRQRRHPAWHRSAHGIHLNNHLLEVWFFFFFSFSQILITFFCMLCFMIFFFFYKFIKSNLNILIHFFKHGIKWKYTLHHIAFLFFIFYSVLHNRIIK